MTAELEQDRQKVRDLIKDIRFAMMATNDGDQIVSRPMTPQRIDDDLTVWFITQRSTDVAGQADGHPVNLVFVEGRTFVSVSGAGELVDDVELKKELWDTATSLFTEGGPEDPENVLLAVRTTSAGYWDSASAPVTAWGVVKAAVTGDRPRTGEHDTVEL